MICFALWKRLILLQQRKLILGIPLLRDEFYHRRGRGFAQNGIIALVESVCRPCLVWRQDPRTSSGYSRFAELFWMYWVCCPCYSMSSGCHWSSSTAWWGFCPCHGIGLRLCSRLILKRLQSIFPSIGCWWIGSELGVHGVCEVYQHEPFCP